MIPASSQPSLPRSLNSSSLSSAPDSRTTCIYSHRTGSCTYTSGIGGVQTPTASVLNPNLIALSASVVIRTADVRAFDNAIHQAIVERFFR